LNVMRAENDSRHPLSSVSRVGVVGTRTWTRKTTISTNAQSADSARECTKWSKAMSDIKSKPDENGVRWCDKGCKFCELPEGQLYCTITPIGMLKKKGDICLPAMVQIVKAATQIAVENIPIDRKGKYRVVSIEAIEALVEALSYE